MNLCSNCSTEAEYFDTNAQCNKKNILCIWEGVTQEYNPLFDDQTLYEIRLCAGNDLSKEVLKAVSKISNKNYLDCKHIIENHESILTKGRADEVAAAKALLDVAGVNYLITPDFPW